MSPGHDTRYLTDAVTAGREGYYTAAVAAGEPPGVWYGRGAAALGLAGRVDADLMEAIYSELLDPRDEAAHSRATWGEARMLSAGHRHYQTPEQLYEKALEQEPLAGPERRAELWAHAERAAHQAVSFIDLTFNAPKSWSVAGAAFERASNLAYRAGDLHEAARWEELQRTVDEAARVGARASIDYLEDHAGYGRVGKWGGPGGNRWIDSHQWVVAQFLQHDSRTHDPHLHVHQAVLNRQLCADGKWRALDRPALRAWKAGAGAVGERAMEAYAAQRAGLRVELRPDGVARELMGVDPALMAQFSKRTAAIDPKTEELAEVFRERYGREPSLHEWGKLGKQATMATRPTKSHDSLTAEQRMDRWVAETQATVGQDLAATAEAVATAAAQPVEAPEWSPADVQLRALATMGQEKAVWREGELTKQVDRALPARLGIGPELVREVLEEMTATTLREAIPANKGVRADDAPVVLLLADRRSVYEGPGARTYSTPEQVVGERLLREAAVLRGSAALSMEQALELVDRYAESSKELGADQRAAFIGVLTSGAMMETISAPPGTGKSFLLGAIADAWRETGRQMFGLASTQVATDRLAEEGLTGANVTAWLRAQERIAEGKAVPGDAALALRPGAIVTIDEASMTSWADVAAVRRVCDAHGAKLLNVGDPKQLGPVGPGGALTDMVDHGLSYELTTVRRFEAPWEAQASLDLRDGKPTAIAEYSKHGRLVSGGSLAATEAKARQGWLADTLAGMESLLVCGTNEQTARLSAELRNKLVELGKVSAEGVPLGLQGTTAGVGDLVQARRNAWDLKGWAGNVAAPINRQTYQVVGLRDDGGLTVAPIMERSAEGPVLGDQMQLPGYYVDRHLALGYASTAHAAEGRNVATGHALYGAGMDAASVLVSLTRGTQRNTGYAPTQQAPARDSVPGEVAAVKQRTAESILADLLEHAQVERGALAQAEQAERDQASTATNAGVLIDGISTITKQRTGAALDRLVAAAELDPDERTRMASDPAMWSVDSLLRRAELAGHDPVAVLGEAVRARNFANADSPAQVLHKRLTNMVGDQLAPAVRSFGELIPASTPTEWRPWLERHADAADERVAALGTQTAIERPQWAVEALGEVPHDPVARLEWEDKAGIGAACREMLGHEDPADALGDAPPAGLPEKNAMWRVAHAALDLPDAGPEQRAATEGLLRAQVAAYEREERWAPPYVADELTAVARAEAQARERSLVCAAQVDAESDPQRAQMVRAEAEQAAAELDVLADQRVALEQGDLDRAMWAAHTAVTRAQAEAARDELAARGVDLANPPDLTSTQEWLKVHRAEQAAAETATTEVAEVEVADPELEAAREELDAEPVMAGPVAETGLAETAAPDIRETATTDVREHESLEQRRRVPLMDETHRQVERAQEAVAEIAARAELDALADTTEDEAAVARYGNPAVLNDEVDVADEAPVVQPTPVDSGAEY
ncbi:MAG: MobF family relaxase [Pseudonocardiaceae bacterium]